MSKLLQRLASGLDRGLELARGLMAIAVYLRTGVRFARVGRHTKIRGGRYMTIGRKVRIGDFCWIEAVAAYGGRRYQPRLEIGDRVALSDLTHISCVERIHIGDDCLLGSKIYIGDHNHGNMDAADEMLHIAPSRRPLGNIEEITIGEMSWIGDHPQRP